MSIVLSGSLILTGSISASGNLTTLGTITAQTLVVQTITSSIVNLTGSNIFGSRLTDTQTFTGSVVMTGSLTVNTTGTEFQVTNNGLVMGNLLTDNHSMTGSFRVTGSGTFSSTISAIGESTLFQGAFNDPVPNTVAVLKMSSIPTPSLASTVVGARMSGSATANVDTYAGYFSNISTVSGTGLAYGIFATASFHTFIGETRFAQGVFNDPINGTAASIKISAIPTLGAPTAVFTSGITGTASSNQNTFAGYFTNTSTVSGTGINYGIFATGSRHFFGGNIGIGTTSPGYTAASRQVVAINGGSAAAQGSILAFMQAGVNKGYVFSIQDDMEVWCESGQVRIGNNANASVIIKTQNTDRLTISGSGNVGIGTTTPTSLLEAQANQNAQTGIRVRNSTAGTSAGVEFGAYTNSGNGGFGKYSTGNTPYKNISAASTYVYNGASGDIALLNDVAAGNISFAAGSASTAQMFLSASGNVGIGTTSPSTVFHVNGSTPRMAVITTSGALSSGFYDAFQILAANQTGGGLSLNVGKAESNNNLAKMVYFHSSDGSTSNRLGFGFYGADGLVNILASGNVGFNTTSPTGSRATNLVQVAGSLAVLRVGPWFSTDDRDFVELQADGANTRVFSPNEDFSFHNPVGNANITGSNINLCATGNINFRTTAGGSNTLNVYAPNATGANASLYLEAAGVVGGGMYQDRGTSTLRVWQATSTVGVSLANNATSWGSFSDERMKDIIEPIENAVDKVNTLRAVIGKYKTDEEDKRRPFLIAQDVQSVLPEAIYDDRSEEKLLSLSYTDVIPLLVASIKELTERVKELENK